jgi:hypothetical protein
MPAPVCCPTAALDVILLLASHPPRHEVVCLLLDADHRGRSSFVVTDAPRDVTDLTASIALVCAELPWVRAVVLACCSPGGGYLPTALEQIAFLESRERFDLIGVELLDWFVLDAGRAASLAEATDARHLWRHGSGTATCCSSLDAAPV